jgi:hypothetical protein
MPVPSLITDLSTTAATNSPAGSENVFPNLDDYLRAQAAFLASVRDNSGNGWVSPYLALAGGTLTGGVETTSSAATQVAGAITLNCNLSNVFASTLTASITSPTYSNAADGQTINWFITQGGVGSFTIAWSGVTAVKWPGGAAGVLSTAVGAVDLVVLTYRSSTGFWYANLSKGYA